MGTEHFDDAGVVKYDRDTGLVLTVDYFTPVVDSPQDFGRIAAANSLSDIYAMGGEPIAALNIVGFPENKLPLEVLVEILAGGQQIADEAGIPIVGGHSVKSPEPFYGMSVTGKVEIDKLMTNDACQPGDLLFLTKPIGSGLITTAARSGKADRKFIEAAIGHMTQLNKNAAIAAVKSLARAATDITGYGLLGHLFEMVTASAVSAIVDFNSVPLMDGVIELAALNLFPGGTNANLMYLDDHIDWQASLSLEQKRILCDAQTSGGLIISIAPDKQAMLEKQLDLVGQKYWIIGRITAKEKWPIKVIAA